ncbi:unnamed protein product [Sphagnum tenellum]
MDQYAADIGHGVLPDLEWHAIDGVSTFFRVLRQVMESLAADHKLTLDLVLMSVSLLLKHCDDNELKLQEIDGKLTMVEMKAKLEKYKRFIDILSWWSARKELLPSHYQMAMDYHIMLATSTPSEQVNSVVGCEFTCTRQSLSSSMFIMTMCMRSWMNADILKVLTNRTEAAATLGQDGANNVESVVQELEEEQEDWDEEILDDGVIQMLHN